MTVRTMYDSVTASKIPVSAAMVAGYIDGRFAWTAADWLRFPHAEHVMIATRATTNAGDVIDCEQGDATPAQAAAWVRMRKAAGVPRPTIYCSRSVIPAVRAATGSLILGRDYDIWVADWTNAPHQVTAPGLPAASCAATQYENTASWDLTAVYDDGWPHRQAPAPPPPAAPSKATALAALGTLRAYLEAQ